VLEERVHFKSDDVLEGVLHQPENGAVRGAVVVCHPHPLYGGNMDYHVVQGVARACAARGMAALRFNFRGVAGSGGRYDSGDGEVRDVAAAVAYLCEQVSADAPLGLAGYSFGSLVAARYVADGGRVDALALVAFVVSADDFNADDYAGLARYTGPLLVVAGGRDAFGPPQAVEATLARLGARGQVVAFPEADHFFLAVTQELRETVAGFFAQSLGQNDMDRTAP
jgi:alpha/beta superfamily hydrolase